jgi:hypothetical protein
MDPDPVDHLESTVKIAGQQIGDPGFHHQPGGWTQDEIFEAVSDLDRNDPGGLSQEMGFAAGLPVGGAEFHRAAFASGKEDQAWTTDRQ